MEKANDRPLVHLHWALIVSLIYLIVLGHPAATVPAPSWGFGPARMILPRHSPYECIQDEGYGRWTYCGQGRG